MSKSDTRGKDILIDGHTFETHKVRGCWFLSYKGFHAAKAKLKKDLVAAFDTRMVCWNVTIKRLIDSVEKKMKEDGIERCETIYDKARKRENEK